MPKTITTTPEAQFDLANRLGVFLGEAAGTRPWFVEPTSNTLGFHLQHPDNFDIRFDFGLRYPYYDYSILLDPNVRSQNPAEQHFVKWVQGVSYKVPEFDLESPRSVQFKSTDDKALKGTAKRLASIAAIWGPLFEVAHQVAREGVKEADFRWELARQIAASVGYLHGKQGYELSDGLSDPNYRYSADKYGVRLPDYGQLSIPRTHGSVNLSLDVPLSADRDKITADEFVGRVERAVRILRGEE